ncbi:glycosyl transferase family 2 [Devosia yakushimensis]|uniref:Glycosyl transferase family 2 n=2 Tax=Devosia yakushimensis TaxID=470028 RepID=A0ABQ5UJ85_9HYPH|nr:glycosyl transferase family 2 [Devosia yakushimensis]
MEMNDVSDDLTILMASYEGEEFLGPQIESFANQDATNIHLVVSDDSKSDRTRNALYQIIQSVPKIDLQYAAGPQKGFAENFRSLLLNCTPKTDFIAFSDQDDIWLADKTQRSINWLRKQPSHVPALYCGRTRMIDREGHDIGRLSPLFSRVPAFENALVQSIAGGNTMTMNRAAFDILKRSLSRAAPVSHDWWAYIMVSGSGGVVKYDQEPLTLYRQHGGNLIGENRSYLARAARLRMVVDGTWRRWQDRHIELLDDNIEQLTSEARATLQSFKHARLRSPLGRLNWLRQSGVWRQTRAGTVSLYVASLMGRL